MCTNSFLLTVWVECNVCDNLVLECVCDLSPAVTDTIHPITRGECCHCTFLQTTDVISEPKIHVQTNVYQRILTSCRVFGCL